MKQHTEISKSFEEKVRFEVGRGNWEIALALCEETIALAELHGDQDTRDIEHCNYSSILVNQGRGREVISKLRQILLGSTNPEICHQAANNISRFHEMRNESERGLFYARLSLDHAKRTHKSEPVARSYNQLGLLLLRDSYFEEATECFTNALCKLSQEPSRDRGVLLSNLGYCQIMLDLQEPGFENLFRSLRMLRKHSEKLWEMYPRLGLSFAYLGIDRPERACLHASHGLELAEAAGMNWQVKNALYLLGESQKLLGNEFKAHQYFTRLQEEFYS